MIASRRCRKFFLANLGFSLLTMLCGCGPSKLDRPQAMRLLSESPKCLITRLPLPGQHSFDDLFDCFIKVGFEERGGDYRVTHDQNPWVPTALGKRFLRGEETETELVTPVKIEIREITGIAQSTAGPEISEVDFSYTYPTLQEPLGSCITPPATLLNGKASFRRYDDGWRVEEVRF